MPITIDKPSKYFNTVLYTGDGTSPRSITGVGFKPDLVWSKSRSTAENHNLYDAVRGGTQGLRSNLTNAETSSNIYGYVSTFDSDGVTYISGGTNNDLNNGSGVTFVNWNWLGANTSGSSNTSGTITSTVSANTTSGFSIVSYTGNGTSGATIGHGLGVTPKMFIIKARGASVNWRVYHSSIGNTAGLALNTTGGSDTNSGFFNNTSPTSTVFTVGDGSTVNTSSGTYIAYCFADVKGFSKFGSYTGNGNANGTFIYTGFRPSFFLIKNTTTAGNGWHIFDNKRIGFNTSNYQLTPSGSDAEDTTTGYTDILSNGFKMRSTNDFNNKSGDTYIYMAFSENPFVSSKGVPVCAR
jgi:hypothetical protein